MAAMQAGRLSGHWTFGPAQMTAADAGQAAVVAPTAARVGTAAVASFVARTDVGRVGIWKAKDKITVPI